jgi:FkbM family methyltransferase
MEVEGRFNVGELLAAKTAIVEAVVRTDEGRFHFDIRDQGVGWMLARGRYEPLETAVVKHFVEPGDLCVDAGANLGWYATVMARRVGPTGAVLAFEPDAGNFALLRTNLADNGIADRVRAFELALYERDGEIEFELSPDNFGDHRLRARSGAPSFHEAETGPRSYRRVPARTLDGVLAELGLADRPIRLLKVDTQGAEVAIFRGAGRALAAAAVMTAEFWPYGLARAGYTVDDYVTLVSAQFGQFARLNTEDLKMAPIAELAADVRRPPDSKADKPDGFSNYLFLK